MGYPGMGADLAHQAPPGVGMPPQVNDGRGRISTPPPAAGGRVNAFDQTQPIDNGHFAGGGYGGGPHAGMAPPQQGMGGPPPGYGAPQGYGGPPMGGPPPGYGAPPPGYGGPPPGNGGPPKGGVMVTKPPPGACT